MSLGRIRSSLVKLQIASNYRTFLRSASSSYKSKYSLENIYPNSDQNFLRKVEIKQTYSNDTQEEFTGYIPLDDIQIKAVRGSGPGGQNVNKVSSKVEVRFHVGSASWIPHWIKENLIKNEKSKITKEGYLVVTSEKTRTQMLNQADCLNKVREMIYRSSEKLEEMTEEDTKILTERFVKANEIRLRRKKAESLKKRNRRSFDD
ncbi:peptidyl-tRNA hydrolase ICT1, mitochondrial-like [Ostrea edulis]|uniref:peptidyl-tRNA hydrolase ICT1, mitochondrial-like n=1 Tax=Ostrea edulis TaxID=37623 RepID=UPI0020959F90|nr:peptidyl-tRNA hydrolase ICT1, mitochondrial-like [Ostrea edulis]